MPLAALGPILIGAAGTSAAATTAAWGAIAAGTAAAGSLAAASKQAGAAKTAAQIQSDAATKAAQIQSNSAAQALAFQQDQAKRDQATFEATQHANYNQWAAREGRMSSLGGLVGLGPRQIPAYVPTTLPPAGMTSTPAGSGNYYGTYNPAPPSSGVPSGSTTMAQGAPNASLANLAPPSGTTIVRLQAPGGAALYVPAGQADQYLARGYQRVA